MIIYTTAPKDYDYSYVKEVVADYARSHGKVVRMVEIPGERVDGKAPHAPRGALPIRRLRRARDDRGGRPGGHEDRDPYAALRRRSCLRSHSRGRRSRWFMKARPRYRD